MREGSIAFAPHYIGVKEFIKGTITGHFGFAVEETRMIKRFQIGFRPHENEKPAFSNSCGLKSVF